MVRIYDFLNNNLFILVVLQWVGTIDLAANEEADANVIVSKDANWSTQAEVVMSGMLFTIYFCMYICVYFFFYN